MSLILIIVESPAKAIKIQKMLGNKYLVKSSFGHLRNLKGKNKGVLIEKNFKPVFTITKKKEYNTLKSCFKKAKKVVLATDEDREGEAIAWHIADLFKLDVKNTDRIVFHEITKSAILNALENPRRINMNIVNAQKYRQILDYLVGFQISPVLWKYIKNNLSAGRVQSVTVRLIQDRINEILNFKHTFYYKTNGLFNKNIKSLLNKKFIKKDDVMKFLNDCKTAEFTIQDISKKKLAKKPPVPFITSTIQIECNRRFKISTKNIMKILQKLYENGYITYHRTDSTNICDEISEIIQGYIVNKYGDKYLNKQNIKQQKNDKVKGAQEAHEAIRPTQIDRQQLPDQFNDIEKKIYNIIWKRTIASFMSNMIYNKFTMKISISNRKELFIANSNVTIFDGFTILYKEYKTQDEKEKTENVNNIDFTKYKIGTILKYTNITSKQTLTKSKKRYTEASLIKHMEKLGIGRPSTYASIISVIQTRKYIEIKDLKGDKVDILELKLIKNNIEENKKETVTGKEKKAMCITPLGKTTNTYLLEQFPKIMNYEFTSLIEKELDKVASGIQNKKLVKTFYNSFSENVIKLMKNKGLKINKLYNNKEMNQEMSKKLIGVHHKSGKKMYGYNAKFGPVIQLGEDDDPEKRYVGVDDFESISEDKANELLRFPRNLGEYKSSDILLKKGKYGFYLSYGGKNYKILKEYDENLTYDEAVSCIVSKNKSIIKTFSKSNISVRIGAYGPYILYNGKFTSIPKEINPEEITEEQCLELLDNVKMKIKKCD